jgi:acyl-CoA synthetase (AMP-forming)/AMP-acid ligase II
MVSLLDKLDYWADKDPDKLLFAFLDIDGNQTDKYTYREFIHRTDVIAGNLFHEYHFKKNDRVLLA